jgi:hypothetical protein
MEAEAECLRHMGEEEARHPMVVEVVAVAPPLRMATEAIGKPLPIERKEPPGFGRLSLF